MNTILINQALLTQNKSFFVDHYFNDPDESEVNRLSFLSYHALIALSINGGEEKLYFADSEDRYRYAFFLFEHMLECGFVPDTSLKALLYLLSSRYADTKEKQYRDSLRQFKNDLDRYMNETKGSHVKHIPLHMGFPHNIPDQNMYNMKRMLGAIQNNLNLSSIEVDGDDTTDFDCGCTIDNRIFNVADFGACPICQKQRNDLTKEEAPAISAMGEKVEPVILSAEYIDGYKQLISNILTSKTSVKMSEMETVRSALENNILSAEEVADISKDIVFKEIKTLVLNYILVNGVGSPEDLAVSVSDLYDTATDVLRIAKSLSTHQEETEYVPLSNTKFKLSARNRKLVLALLDNVKNPLEDLKKYRMTWIRLAEVCHPGQYQKRFTNAYRALDKLRNNYTSIQTFNGRVEEAITNKDLDSLLNTLKERPGEFVRRLDFVIRTFQKSHKKILKAFNEVGINASSKSLIEAYNSFSIRNKMNYRTFYPVGSKSHTVVDERKNISDSVIESVKETIVHCLKNKFATMESLGKVAIDESFKDLKVPLKMRSAKDSIHCVERGSVINFEDSFDVIRFFVYWNEGEKTRVDIDLSVSVMNEDFTPIDSCCYYQIQCKHISTDFIKHSGDVQSGPGSEFIDIKYNDIIQNHPEARYISMYVNVFSGLSFDEYEVFTGFMYRTMSDSVLGKRSVTDGKHFEASAVKEKFDIYGEHKGITPVIIDLKEKKIIWCNITSDVSKGSNLSNVEESLAAVLEQICTESKHGMSIYDLIRLHVESRGEFVDLDSVQENEEVTIIDKSYFSNMTDVSSNWL